MHVLCITVHLQMYGTALTISRHIDPFPLSKLSERPSNYIGEFYRNKRVPESRHTFHDDFSSRITRREIVEMKLQKELKGLNWRNILKLGILPFLRSLNYQWGVLLLKPKVTRMLYEQNFLCLVACYCFVGFRIETIFRVKFSNL